MNQTNTVIFKANLVNCGIILIVGWSVSVILYSMRVQEFVSQKTIEAQNKMLKDSLEALDESQNLILSLNAALESKDAYTGGHSERVAKYAVELAKHMGLSEADQVLLLRAATLHDIGKIGIPDAILNKSGSLSQDEWLVMCSHPEKSESICSKLKFTHDALPIIRHHHEKYDGTGYPDRLKGDQIPYLARIVSIADAVDAITSNRSYRPARPMQVALEELERGSGTQFDPELVNAFLSLQHLKKLEESVI
jgi:putative nucleotidyltransferase with HDIG domain